MKQTVLRTHDQPDTKPCEETKSKYCFACGYNGSINCKVRIAARTFTQNHRPDCVMRGSAQSRPVAMSASVIRLSTIRTNIAPG